jgi:hypothetical protein
MFKYLHNGTYHTDTSTTYLENLGLDEGAIKSVLNQKAFEDPHKSKVELALSKKIGVEINGYQVSLNEVNQNGLASVLTGLNLASESGFDIFPISFVAENQTGEVSIPFDDLASFKEFSLQFLHARQVFFN